MVTRLRQRRTPHLVGTAALCGLLALLPACQSASDALTAPEESPKPVITVTPGGGTDGLAPGEPVSVKVSDGTLKSVRVTAGSAEDGAQGATERVTGSMQHGKRSWTSSSPTEFATTYQVTAKAGNGERTATTTRRFSTVDPERTVQAHVAPLEGEKVGVGMPIAIYFTNPVKNRAAVEKRLEVQTSEPLEGSWYWLDDEELHYRPRTYWPANTDVSVRIPLDGVDAGNGTWGDEDREISFRTGDAIVSEVDVNRHEMTVSRNGRVLRTIPVSTGKAGFLTRGGTKVVLDKERDKVMDAESIGIDKDDPEYYRLDVEYAVRVTWSGEFLHAAPWSVGSQGSENVSHGCVGMSTEHAAWYYDLVRRGDVVEVKGSPRDMELRNGFGDWNLSWSQWQRGSALH